MLRAPRPCSPCPRRRPLTPSRSPRWALLLALAAAPSALAAGCAESTPGAQSPLKYTEESQKAYNKALEAFLDRDWEDARALMADVKRKYGVSRAGRMAELRLADIDFEQEKFASAITAYRSFIHDHRTDESIAYARFRISRSLYAQINDTILLPPQEERDQAATTDAYRELNSFLLDNPTTKWTKEAQFMLIMVTGRLVRHELYVARYYLRRGNFEPAVKRIQHALRQYDGSGLEPEAMVLLAETYVKMKKQDDARKVLEQMLAVYPASPFVDPAKHFLADMQAGAVRPAGYSDPADPAPSTAPPAPPGPGAPPATGTGPALY